MDLAPWLRGGVCQLVGKELHYLRKERKIWVPDPEPDFIGYNTFNYFFPGGKGPGGEQSVYLEFAQLPDDPRTICQFLEQYGPLHLKGMLEPQGATPNNAPDALRDVLAAIHTFRNVLVLCQAIHDNRLDLVKAVHHEPLTVAHNKKWDSIRPANSVIDASERLNIVFLRNLFGISLHTFWDQKNKHWLSRWILPSLLSAFYLMLSLDLQGQAIHRQCPLNNYGCDTFFVTTRQRAIYCSERCQKRAKVRRMRDPLGKKKVKQSSQGGRLRGKR